MSRRFVSLILVFSLLNFLFLEVAPAFSATCSDAPNVPLIKTIWGKSGGPKFVAVPDPTGETTTKLSYTYAYSKKGSTDFEPWAEWSEPISEPEELSVEFQSELKANYGWVAFEANAENECGNRYISISRPLITAKDLTLERSQIADDLPLTVESIPNYYFSPEGWEIPQTLTSLDEEVCAFNVEKKVLEFLKKGKCQIQVSQNNDLLESPNPDGSWTFNLLEPKEQLKRELKDRPDDFKGVQIHVVYTTVRGLAKVTPDSASHISNWLDLTNAWMARKLGKRFAFDTYKGLYDISQLDSSLTAKEIAKEDLLKKAYKGNNGGILERLEREFLRQSGVKSTSKYLLFIIDAKMSDSICGLGSMPGRLTLVTVRGDCWDPKNGYLAQIRKINSPSKAIAHELIHNTGVGHPCSEKSDLMIGDGCKTSKVPLEVTLDEKRDKYVGSKKAGANILKAKYWQK